MRLFDALAGELHLLDSSLRRTYLVYITMYILNESCPGSSPTQAARKRDGVPLLISKRTKV